LGSPFCTCTTTVVALLLQPATTSKIDAHARTDASMHKWAVQGADHCLESPVKKRAIGYDEEEVNDGLPLRRLVPFGLTD
jgi:hypothetical protein